MLEIIPKNTKFDFIGHRKIWMTLSAIMIVGTVVLLATRGLNYGIDFAGGAEVHLKLKKSADVGQVRDMMGKGGFKNLTIVQLGEASANEFLVRVNAEEDQLQAVSAKADQALSSALAKGDYEILRVDVVGPAAGGELRKSGFLAMFYTLLCILLYVAVRFDFRYAPGAVIALFHDTMLTLSIFVILQKEFTLQTVAGILTVIGYSNNDTIIVFDRIRETLKNYPGKGLEENINKSINETLSRTILTSMTTLMTVTALMVYGGGAIHDFAFTLFVGMIVGTYSSVFIASPLFLWVSRMQERREGKGPRKNTSPVLGGKPV